MLSMAVVLHNVPMSSLWVMQYERKSSPERMSCLEPVEFSSGYVVNTSADDEMQETDTDGMTKLWKSIQNTWACFN